MLTRTGIIGAINRVRPRISGKLTILAYHRVLDVPDEESYPFDIDLVSASVSGFRDQMQFLRRHFNPISFETLFDCQDRGVALPKGAVIVTFDDGFEDNHRNAFPILKETGVPATVFLTTDFIDSQQTIWYESLAYRVMRTKPFGLQLSTDPPVAIHIADDRASRIRALQSILDILKRVSDRKRTDLLGELAQRMPVMHDPLQLPLSAPMTWDQVREMSKWGIEFGSHSVTHPILSNLTAEELHFELTASKQRIEEQTGKPVRVLAYPVGGRGAFSAEVKAAARSAGYRLGVSYLGGVQEPASWDPFEVRRVHVERYIDMRMFASTLAIPEAFIPRKA